MTSAAIVGIACSDDGQVGLPGPANMDASATSSSSGGSSSGASSSGASSSGSVVEPTCTALAGEPQWSNVDHKLDWTRPASAGPLDPADNGAAGLAYGNGVFVLVAKSSDEDRIRSATSTDGLTWTQHDEKVTQPGAYTTGSALHFTGKKFVFFGAQSGATYAYSSANGTTWQANKVADGAVNVSAFASNADGLTVAAGANGSLRSSPDLVTWTNHGEGTTSYLNVAFGDGRWVATSNGAGTVYGGTDGSTWAPLTISGTPAGGFANLVFGRGTFIMSSSTYLLSTDGQAFAPAARTGDSQLGTTSNGATRFAGNRFVLFGIDGNNKSTFAATVDGKKWDNFGTVDLTKEDGFAVPNMVVFGQCRYVALASMSKDGNQHTKLALLGAAGSPAQ